jgi:peptidoglycan/xylan/chitin deacetylase (PgdA/CDA1 family)
MRITPTQEHRIASLSLDLDDKWAYLKTNGDPNWKAYPSYLEVLVPRVLKILLSHELRATFFIVGKDASLTRNAELLRAVADAGHEIGNHSFLHDPWLHLYSDEKLRLEIAQADMHITRATGRRPVGFRGPGYSLSPGTLRELVRHGYLYDATTFPTFVMPLIRRYFFAKSNFTLEEKRQRRWLGGRLQECFRPNKPYFWNVDGKRLVEIPVTTLPGFRLPMHMSYLMALYEFSERLALGYLDLSLCLCRLMDVHPSLLLHPTDFLGQEDGQGLFITPGMKLPVGRKLKFIDQVLGRLRSTFSVVTIREHVEYISHLKTLRVLAPTF